MKANAGPGFSERKPAAKTDFETPGDELAALRASVEAKRQLAASIAAEDEAARRLAASLTRKDGFDPGFEQLPDKKALGVPASAKEPSHRSPPPRPKARIEVRDIGDLKHRPPPREWLLGLIFCRRFLSQLLADGAVGKTALRYAQYLALDSGRPITDEHVFARGRVLILSFEDGIDELERRLWAAMIHHGISPKEVSGWVHYAALSRNAGKLKIMDEKSRVVDGELTSLIEGLITNLKIDLVGLDPFIKTHSVGENNNDAIDAVTQVLTDMSHKHNIAVDAPHHISKGQADPGNAQRGRGASAFVDAGRLAYTLTPMSADEAKLFDISPEEQHSYVRLDKGKVNIAPPARIAKWFRLVGVAIGNATDAYPQGDNVQTVEPWTPPEIWQDLDTIMLNRILDTIDAGLPDGNRYTNAAKAGEREAWRVIAEHAPEKIEAQGREIISTWVKTGVLVVKSYQNPKTTKSVKGLYVVAAKRPL